MQIDFHYYATYCASILAGYSHAESLDICTAAQYVDCCTKTSLKKMKAPLSAATTQTQMEMMEANPSTLNHELLMNLIRKNVTDTRVIELIKRYLKAGVMENGLRVKTTEGSPQGGPLSPLLANIYLNEYDKEMAKRGVPVIRYADDVVVLARSPRAAQRFLETTQRYLEGKLKLKMNMGKSRVVSVYSIRNFKKPLI